MIQFLFSLKNHFKKEHWSKQIGIPILLLILSIIFAAQAFYEAGNMKMEQEKFADMAKEVASLVEKDIHLYSQESLESTNNLTENMNTPMILPRYMELAQQNPELYGWVRIDNTILDYPVMHTPSDPEKYLQLNFDCEYSTAGTIFMDYRCSAESDNLILYGHNMKNGTMFGSILNYQDKEYWNDHKIIHFDTLYEQQDFEVVAAFFDCVHYINDTSFKYYNFIDCKDEKEYTDAIRTYREKALYDTGVLPEYGDQLLTLSTCDYHVKDGRFVVLARKI